MKRALAVLILAILLPGCGLFEKLTGGGDKKEALQGTPEPAPVTPIAPEKLAGLLPKPEGWDTQAPVGDYVDAGKHKATRATATYTKKIEELTVSAKLTIVDGAHATDVYGPLARMAHGGREANPHMMPVAIEGYSGLQEIDPASHKVSVALVVARRFLITLEGENLLQEYVSAFLHGIDVKKLAEWAGEKPPANKPPAAPAPAH